MVWSRSKFRCSYSELVNVSNFIRFSHHFQRSTTETYLNHHLTTYYASYSKIGRFGVWPKFIGRVSLATLNSSEEEFEIFVGLKTFQFLDMMHNIYFNGGWDRFPIKKIKWFGVGRNSGAPIRN